MIIADSDGLLEELPRRRQGPRRYRLTIPDALRQPPLARTGSGGDEHYAQLQTTLLNTAEKIATLIADYHSRGADPHIEWSATCGEQPITWDNFFYSPPRIHTLDKRIRDTEDKEATPLTHPVVVLTQLHKAGDGPRKRWCQARYSTPGTTNRDLLFINGLPQLITPTIPDNDTDQCVLGFGMWHIDTWSSPHRLTLTITRSSQLHEITNERLIDYISQQSWPNPQ